MFNRFVGHVYSVGDGFCNEGIIIDGEERYHFVIDCGSQPPKKKKCDILSTKQECDDRLDYISDNIVRNCEHLNLFILSHLHNDHYNGIQKLFKKSMPDTIIMPYLYPEERLCLALGDSGNNSADDFILNPYSTILDMIRESGKDTKLILVRGNSQQIEGENNYWGNSHREQDNIKRIENIISEAVDVVSALTHGTIPFKSSYQFKLFNLENDGVKLQNLRDKVKQEFGKEAMTAKDLCDLLKTKKKLAEIRKRYADLAMTYGSDINNTSIVVYGGVPEYVRKRNGFLITGDISFKKGYAKKILDFFADEIDNVAIFSIPHHGSDGNWDDEFIEDNSLDHTICFVTTHNFYSNRLQPNMMSSLRSHNIETLVVDELWESSLKIHIINRCGYYVVKKRGHGSVVLSF